MLTRPLGRSVLATVVLTISGLAVACDSAPTTAPRLEPADGPALAKGDRGALVAQGTFTVPAPPAMVNAPCVDADNMLGVTGTWSGWFRASLSPSGRLHTTEHIDWSDVTLVAADGRTWKPGPGAHESFSFNEEITADGVFERTIMHNLRARFISQDGDSDLQVWHTIHIVRGPDREYRRIDVVLPFEAFCIGGRS